MTKTLIDRRTFVAGSLLASGGLVAGAKPAFSQTFPNRPVTVIVPLSAGGSTDNLMRVAAPIVSKLLGQPVVVEARPGAATAVGATLVARAKPDGYTLLTHFGSMLMLPFVQKVEFDPIKDFSLIVGQHSFCTTAVVKADSKYKTIKDLVEAAKANPGKISVGTSGPTTGGHLTIVRFEERLGVKFLHVPFKGTEYNTALLGGHIEAIFAGPNWMGMVDGGQARALALFDDKRVASYPDIPTASELGIPIIERNSCLIAGPAGMSPEVVKVLRDAFDTAHKTEEFQSALKKFLCQFWNPSGKDLDDWASQKHEADRKMALALNLKP